MLGREIAFANLTQHSHKNYSGFASDTFQTFFQNQLELLQKRKEEAYIMADAFRIAFEQQLIRKNDQALRLTQMDKMCKKETKWINWKHLKEDGKYELS